MRRAIAGIAALAFCIGCTTVAKQAYYTATGPQGSFLIISTSSPNWDKYTSLEVARFANEIPSQVGPMLVDAVQEFAVKQMLASRYFETVAPVASFAQGKAAKPTLVVRGTLFDIISDRMPGQKLFDANYLTAVIEIADKETGAAVAKANVRGVVKSVAETGETPLAEGMARGLRKLFKELMQKVEPEG